MSGASARRLQVVDSHTGGEPTRIVVGGGPELAGDLARQLAEFRSGHDELRGALINEPRGSDVLVGGLLRPGVSTGATAGILFFNNVGYLGMCGHGTIGLVTTLEHLGRIAPGEHLIDTPVGPVRARLHDSGEVSVRNVPAFRQQQGLRLTVPGLGEVSGDVAWGGNWFFICEDHGLTVDAGNLPALLAAGSAIQERLQACGIRGGGGALIDHVELCGPSSVADSRNFVLCPGGAYDRSPCGTGTSAKMACLFAKGKLRAGQAWRQESVIGSRFVGQVRETPGGLIPTLRGRAFVTAEGELVLDDADPFVHGIR